MPIRATTTFRRLALFARLGFVAAVVVTVAHVPLARPDPAAAEVTRLNGYAAIVDGWRSWYGSYGMGALGAAWCIDHGIRAPDPAFAYVPTAADVPLETSRAIAWALGAHGRSPDRITAAALMLAVHDLMGARYPSGTLDVDQLTAERMSGFEGAEVAVLEQARRLKADALDHSHLEGPVSLQAAVVPAGLRPGEQGELDLHLTDRNGAGVGGVLLHAAVTGAVLTGAVEARTDPEGRLRLPFVATAGHNRFDVTGSVPDLQLQAYEPTLRRAQRVARPAVEEVGDSVGFTTRARHSLTISKTGDAEAYLPVTGARFEVVAGDGSVAAELAVGSDGQARAELDSGRYEVRETAAPAGYTAAGPWKVDLTAGDTVLEVPNEARRGSATIRKIDAVTGEPVAGAELVVVYDADADGRYETEVGILTSTAAPANIAQPHLSDLLPGDYVVEEVTAPPGYAPAGPTSFTVGSGAAVEVDVVNRPRSTVAFQKVPAGEYDQHAVSFAGAIFEVAGVGECTTDAAGACALADHVLDGGTEYCWQETRAPPGWGRSEGGCFVATAEPGGVQVIDVAEPSRYAPVHATKIDAETGEVVSGAVYDLYRVDDDRLGPAPARTAPTGAVVLEGHTWVGRGESDPEGRVEWPLQIAGFTYCALEREAPPGYLLDTELTCTDAALDLDGGSLVLRDHPVPTVVERTVVERTVVEEKVVARTAVEVPVVEAPLPYRPELAATGFGSLHLAVVGGALILAGLLLANLRQ